jgi:hypothetical protein
MKKVSKKQIIEIAEELQDVLPDPSNNDLYDAVEDCIGRPPTDVEKRLIVIAYEQNAQTAIGSVWW